MNSGFLDKLLERLGRVRPEEIRDYVVRLADEKGFFLANVAGAVLAARPGGDPGCGAEGGGANRPPTTGRRSPPVGPKAISAGQTPKGRIAPREKRTTPNVAERTSRQ